MTKLGYTLFSELRGPKDLVAQGQRAEEAGFDFAVMSDHFHPWLSTHSDSPFAWSVLGAVAAGRDRDVHIAAITEFIDAGYDEVAVVQVGDDIDGFFGFWSDELAPGLR